MQAVPEPPGASSYRPDIDGLRALAVIAVLFFHVAIPGFKGGYVGVDIFFVVSGYLITQQLTLSRAKSGRELLGTFYVRRARRIIPALLVTCALTAVAGAALLMPRDLVHIGKHLAAAPLFVSNVAVGTDGAGYFQQSFWPQQLYHLWSVAVEEQFYLVYPLLLLLIARYPPQRRQETLAVLALLSLMVCAWASRYYPLANYFALPTRAWELLLGAILALKGTPRLRAQTANELLAAASLLMLAVTIYAYDPRVIAYPGGYTLLPCFAAAALISTGQREGTLVNRLLSWRPLVFVGLISYSLYLLHRPLLEFLTYYNIRPLSAPERSLALLATALLAVLSWYFVEQPVRTRRLFRSTRALSVAALTGSAVVLALGLFLWYSDGFPQRFSPVARALISSSPSESATEPCFYPTPEQVRAGAVCEFGDRHGSGGTALLWGDSHALALLPAFDELAAMHHVHLYFFLKFACWPVLGIVNSGRDSNEQAGCQPFNSNVIAAIKRLDPTTIILGGRWNDAQFIPTGNLRPPADVSLFSFDMQRTLAAINDGGRRSVCLVLDVPTLRYWGSRALVMAYRRSISDDFLAVTRKDALQPLRNMERDARAMARQGQLTIVDPKDVLCPGETCQYKAQGHSLYFDLDHLSSSGARYVERSLASCFAGSHGHAAHAQALTDAPLQEARGTGPRAAREITALR